MGSLRTPEAHAAYKKLVAEGMLSHGCVLCGAESVKDFQSWRIVTNAFPYDRIASVHDMIISKRHVSDSQLTLLEKEELDVIKNEYIHQTYDCILEATYKTKSVPEHTHFHLIVVKD